jgi:hypothetical protein
MKTKLFFLLFVAIGMLFANPVVDTIISGSTAFDTIATTGTVPIVTKFHPKPGYQYILQLDNLTGANNNSCYMEVRVTSRDHKGDTIATTVIDSITSAVGEEILIPFYQTLFGYSFDIKVVGYGSNGAQIIFNKIWMWKRATLQPQKKTWF